MNCSREQLEGAFKRLKVHKKELLEKTGGFVFIDYYSDNRANMIACGDVGILYGITSTTLINICKYLKHANADDKLQERVERTYKSLIEAIEGDPDGK